MAPRHEERVKKSRGSSPHHTKVNSSASDGISSVTVDHFSLVHEDPMFKFIQESKKEEKEDRVNQLKALLESKSSHDDKKKKHKRKHKKEKHKRKNKSKYEKDDLHKTKRRKERERSSHTHKKKKYDKSRK